MIENWHLEPLSKVSYLAKFLFDKKATLQLSLTNNKMEDMNEK